MLTRLTADADATSSPATSIDKIVYVGPRRDFPECLIQAVESNFGEIEIVRVSGLEMLLGDDPPDGESLRLALVHDRMVRTCLERHVVVLVLILIRVLILLVLVIRISGTSNKPAIDGCGGRRAAQSPRHSRGR